MRFTSMITAVDAHAAGNPTRVVTGGLPPIPGATMFEKKLYVEQELHDVWKRLLLEPRGHAVMCATIITPPTDPRADVGMLILEPARCPPMSGHNTISTATVLLETGILPASEPYTELVLDTPAGLVDVRARVEGGSVKEVGFRNVPSFVTHLDAPLDVPRMGRLTVDVAYGGDFYAILPGSAVGLSLEPGDADAILQVAARLRPALRSQIQVAHPENPAIDEVAHVLFTGPPRTAGATARNAVVYPPSAIDRSPCGTGTCARMASLWARGQLRLKEDFVHESLIGTIFHGQLLEETSVGAYRAVVPAVSGRAFITGFNQLVLHPEDPFPAGFSL